MRIHTDVLKRSDLHDACRATGLGAEQGVYVEFTSEHRSTKRARGIEFRLASTKREGHRRRNTGNYGAEPSGYAATYDEHGVWMSHLFDIDPSAIIGPYEGMADFHIKTEGKYPSVRHPFIED